MIKTGLATESSTTTTLIADYYSIPKMALNKVIAIVLLFLFMVQIQTSPVANNPSELEVNDVDEMMETAESQNPFLPRFAMKRLKERREKAQAQRRSNIAQRRSNQQPPNPVKCPQYRYRTLTYYVSIIKRAIKKLRSSQSHSLFFLHCNIYHLLSEVSTAISDVQGT